MLYCKSKQIFHYIKIYPYFFYCILQSKMGYRRDFLLGICASIVMQLLGYTFIWSIFQNITVLNGWSFYQISFIYGMSASTLGLTQFFFDGSWSVGSFVHAGSFDRFLLRPLSTIFSVITSDIALHGIGSFAFGLAICIRSLLILNINVNFKLIVFWLIFAICGALIHFAVNLITASLSIWIINSQSLMMLVYNFSEFNKYPISFYVTTVKILITVIFPYAFCSFYPSIFILGIETGVLDMIGPILVSILVLYISTKIWKFSLRYYQSAGG